MRDAAGPADVIVAFHTRAARSSRRRCRAAGADGADRRAVDRVAEAGVEGPTDITEDVVREVALPNGLVDNKVCAIDATWSGLRLVIRQGPLASSG